MNILILYFSGTGNTEYVANKIASILTELNHQTDIHSTEENVQIEPDKYDRIILGCPKYYEYPVFDFITYLEQKLPQSKKKLPVFIYCTQAGPLATNFNKIERMLKKKNYYITVSKSFPVANNMVIFKAFPLTAEEKIQENLINIQKELSPLLIDFINGKENKEKLNLLIRMVCYVAAILCTKLFSIFGMKYSVTNTCTGCGLCAKKCPKKNIIMKNKKPKFGHQCILCMRCINICPGNSIIYNKKKCEQYKGIHKRR